MKHKRFKNNTLNIFELSLLCVISIFVIVTYYPHEYCNMIFNIMSSPIQYVLDIYNNIELNAGILISPLQLLLIKFWGMLLIPVSMLNISETILYKIYILWYKFLILLFVIGILYYLYKSLRVQVKKDDMSYLICNILVSPIMIYLFFWKGSIYIPAIFCFVAGMYNFDRDKTITIFCWGISILLQYKFFFIFLPIILLKYKRIKQIFNWIFPILSMIITSSFLYLGSIEFQTMLTNLSIFHSRTFVFILFLTFICIWAYTTKTDKTEKYWEIIGCVSMIFVLVDQQFDYLLLGVLSLFFIEYQKWKTPIWHIGCLCISIGALFLTPEYVLDNNIIMHFMNHNIHILIENNVLGVGFLGIIVLFCVEGIIYLKKKFILSDFLLRISLYINFIVFILRLWIKMP